MSAPPKRVPRLAPWHALAALALGWAVTRLLVSLCGAAQRLGWLTDAAVRTPAFDLLTTLLTGALPVLAALVMLRPSGVPRRFTFALRPARCADLLWGALAVWVALRVAASAGLVVGAWFAPARSDVVRYAEQMVSEGALARLVRVAAIALVPPVCEEVFYRGMVYGCLRRHSLGFALVGSTALFAAGHGQPASIASACVLGLVLALLRERSGSVWPGIVGHAAANGGVALLALDRTAVSGAAGVLLGAALRPPAWLLRSLPVAAALCLLALWNVGRNRR